MAAGQGGPAAPLVWRKILLLYACLQTASTAGLVFGWSALEALLVDSGEFSELCPGNVTGCDEQHVRLNHAFVFAGMCSFCAQMPMGLLHDKFGPRSCILLALAGSAVGLFLLSLFHSSSFPEGLDVGLTLLGIFNPNIQMANIHVANLFAPSVRKQATSCITGCFSASFFVFSAVKITVDTGSCSYRSALQALAALSVVHLVVSACVCPDHPFPCVAEDGASALQPTPQQQQQQQASSYSLTQPPQGIQLSLLSPAALPAEPGTLGGDSGASSSVRPRSCCRPAPPALFSAKLWALVFMYSSISLWSNFYIGSISSQLHLMSPSADKETLSGYVLAFNSVAAFASPPCAVLFGTALDRIGLAKGAWAIFVVSILFAISVLLPVLELQVVSFFLWAMRASFLYTYSFVYLAATFGFETFGLLNGVMTGITGILLLSQDGLAEVALAHDSYAAVNAVQLVWSLALCIFPVVESMSGKANDGTDDDHNDGRATNHSGFERFSEPEG